MSGTGVSHWTPEGRETGTTEEKRVCIYPDSQRHVDGRTHTCTCLYLEARSAGVSLCYSFHLRCINLLLPYLACKCVLKHFYFFSTRLLLHILTHAPAAWEEIGQHSIIKGAHMPKHCCYGKQDQTVTQ